MFMLIIGEWLFDPSTRRLVSGPAERRLSPKSAAVLFSLAESPGQVWSRNALLERVWPAVTVGEEVLTHAVAEIRKCLGDDFRSPAYLETVHKSGYRLICRVGGVDPAAREGVPLATGSEFSLASYASYLEACELFDRGGRRNTASAVSTFSSIVAEHPLFCLAHVGLAKSLIFSGTYYAPRDGNLDLALAHCRAAQKIEPGLAEAYAAEGLALAIGGRFARALDSFRKSLVLRPDLAETHYLLGRACFAELNVKLAAPMLERAAALRLDDYHALVLAGKARQMMGDRVGAMRDFGLGLRRAAGRVEGHPDDFRAHCFVARCLVHLGRPDEAEAVIDRLNGHPDPINYHLACTLARAGEAGRALDVLEAVIEEGWQHGAWLARDPDFDVLRGNSRFERVARAIRAD